MLIKDCTFIIEATIRPQDEAGFHDRLAWLIEDAYPEQDVVQGKTFTVGGNALDGYTLKEESPQ